jgi:ferredoxin
MSFEGATSGFPCRRDQSVLLAMSAAGGRWTPIGCRGGGCGVCRVRVISGEFETGVMSAAHISGDDRAQGVVLACQLFPRSDLSLRALGRKGGALGPDPVAALLRHFPQPASPPSGDVA